MNGKLALSKRLVVKWAHVDTKVTKLICKYKKNPPRPIN